MNPSHQFDAALIRQIDAAREVEIETIKPSGGSRRTLIWVVTDGAEVYVRSVRGREGRWYRDLMDRPMGYLHVNDERLAVEAVVADDGAQLDLVDELLRAKYGRTSRASTASMLLDQVRGTTLRLVPTHHPGGGGT